MDDLEIQLTEIPYLYVIRKWAWTFGSRYVLSRGKWNFYIHGLNLKVPYSNGIFLDCRSRATPKRKPLASGKLDHRDFGLYTVDDWKNVLFKTTKRRIIENYIATQRLHKAGLGPAVRGFCYIHSYMVFGRNWAPIKTFGLKIDNVFNLPPKPEATKEEIQSAGVILDKSESCLRQQKNGYVLDLNSVSGVMPTDAGSEIQKLDAWLTRKIQKERR